jgi:iron(III) transport system substrate-binding protein
MNDKETDKKAWADATRDILPTFRDGGTHVNLSGAVIAKHAPNQPNAMKLLEWLVGEQAQRIHADMNYEYPIRAGVPINATIAGYGQLKPDATPMSTIAAQRKTAANLVDRLGFDN